ncbi:hypothetical protein KO465_04645 [Candidatus Micrarchaeota archaeon]|nr:hypothetical protein [Candidatus Micrarchaeota archaeon]
MKRWTKKAHIPPLKSLLKHSHETIREKIKSVAMVAPEIISIEIISVPIITATIIPTGNNNTNRHNQSDQRDSNIIRIIHNARLCDAKHLQKSYPINQEP